MIGPWELITALFGEGTVTVDLRAAPAVVLILVGFVICQGAGR